MSWREQQTAKLYYHNPNSRIPILFTIHIKPYFHEKELEVKVRAHGCSTTPVSREASSQTVFAEALTAELRLPELTERQGIRKDGKQWEVTRV